MLLVARSREDTAAKGSGVSLRHDANALDLAAGRYRRGRPRSARSRACRRSASAGRAEIIDGDSLEIGVDARSPVRRRRARRAANPARATAANGRCGNEAARKLRSLIGDRTVTCTQRDVDDYGRTVAVCRSGAVDLAAEMARSGFATAYRRYSNDYVDEENEARAARRGIWAGEFTPPEEYRRNDRREAPAQRGDAARHRDRAATAATSKATSTAKANGSITCPARRPTTTPSSTRAKASAGSAPKRRRGRPVGEHRAADATPARAASFRDGVQADVP